MTLENQTINYINSYIKNYYYKAFEHGAILSSVNIIGPNMYQVTLGNMIMDWIGTADATAKMVACEGDIF